MRAGLGCDMAESFLKLQQVGLNSWNEGKSCESCAPPSNFAPSCTTASASAPPGSSSVVLAHCTFSLAQPVHGQTLFCQGHKVQSCFPHRVIHIKSFLASSNHCLHVRPELSCRRVDGLHHLLLNHAQVYGSRGDAKVGWGQSISIPSEVTGCFLRGHHSKDFHQHLILLEIQPKMESNRSFKKF